MRRFSSRIASIFCFGVLCASSNAQNVLFTARGNNPGDFFGATMRGGGDVDGDGLPDVIVGAPQIHPALRGKGFARVMIGRTGALLYQWIGDAVGDQFGSAVSIVGDVNADGYADACVGAPKNAANGADSGLVRVFSGQSGAILHEFHGAAGDELGTSVCAVGDVDQDGRDDFAIGAPQGVIGIGYVVIRSGATGALLRQYTGQAAGDRFGAAIALAGDVDGDGRVDWIVGAPGGSAGLGAAYVYSGATGLLLYTFTGPSAASQFGASLDGAGDVNHDGHADLIVGAWRDTLGFPGNFAGSVWVYSGRDGSLLMHFQGITADDFLGHTVAGVGDIDGDGYDDFTTYSEEDPDFNHPGAVFVHSGRDGSILMSSFGDHDQDAFGSGLARVGDVDGDGFDDVFIGAPESYHSHPSRGYARMLRGGPGRIVTYGRSCPGAAGLRPQLAYDGRAEPAASAVLRIRVGAPSVLAIVRFGRERSPFLTSGCSNSIAALLPIELMIPLDASGSGSKSFVMPLQVGTLPRTTMQAFLRDPMYGMHGSATSAIDVSLH